jgi:hypothetical protein
MYGLGWVHVIDHLGSGAYMHFHTVRVHTLGSDGEVAALLVVHPLHAASRAHKMWRGCGYT